MTTAKKVAAKKVAAKPAKAPEQATSTAVAVKKANTAVGATAGDIKARLAALAAAQEGKTAPVGGNKIRITQDKQFVLPDGTKSRGPLELVVVDFVSKNTYYPGAFDRNNPTPPACFAIGDIPLKLVPSDNSPDKQADTCAECPMNVFGSAGDGKACKNGRALAVLPPDADADTDLWLLDVSPTALKSWDGYVKDVQRMYGVPVVGVVTTVEFSDAQYPQLSFGNAQPNENVGVHLDRIEEAKQMLMEEPDVSQYGQEKPKAAPARKVVAAKRR